MSDWSLSLLHAEVHRSANAAPSTSAYRSHAPESRFISKDLNFHARLEQEMVFATDSLDAEVTLLHPVQAVKAQRTFLTFPDAGERNWMKAPGQQRSFFSTLRVSQYCGRCA